MRFSTRTRYGLRFLIRLASQPAGTFVQLAELARKEEISPGYLEQIVRTLRPTGILRTVRGANGGYMLARPASEITLEEIFQGLEGGLSPVICVADGNCTRQECCSTRPFWLALDAHIRSFLRSVTLQALLTDKNTPCRALSKKCLTGDKK